MGHDGLDDFRVPGMAACQQAEEEIAVQEGGAWWQAQRTYGLARAVRQSAEKRELIYLANALETPTGQKRLRKQLSEAHPKEYRVAI